jgi:hypothetical protein
MDLSLGDCGGKALRMFTLSGHEYMPGEPIDAEVLKQVPWRHKSALKEQGYVKFYDPPETESLSVRPKKAPPPASAAAPKPKRPYHHSRSRKASMGKSGTANK